MFAIIKADSVPQWVMRAFGVPALLDIDPINARLWMRGVRSPNDVISCSRGSVGYYPNPNGTLTSFAAHTNRIGQSGHLVEEQRINVLTNSQTFASWGVIAGTATDNQTTAPDGTLTASKYVNANTGGNQLIFKSAISLTSGNTYAYSMYQKAAGYNFGNLCVYDGAAFTSAIVDLTNGAVTNAGNTARLTIVSATSDALANGWYRIKFVFSTNTTANCTIYTGASNANTFSGGLPTSFTADGTSGVYIWGGQFEAGSFVTSYVPTTGAGSATRNSDAVTMPIPAGFNPLVGTLYAETSILANAGVQFGPCFDDGTGANQIVLFPTDTGNSRGFVVNGSSTVVNIGGTMPAVGAVCKQAMAWSTDNVSSSTGGVLDGTDNTATLPSGLTTLRLGDRSSGGRSLNGFIRRVAYWPFRVNDAALSRLTV